MILGLSLNTATVKKRWSLPEIIDGAIRHKIPAIAPWRDQVQKTGIKKTASLIKDSELALSGYCRGGMFPGRDAYEIQSNIDDNFRAIDEAVEIGAEVLVMVVGGLLEGMNDLTKARCQVYDGLKKILNYAKQGGVKIAIEPLHPMYAADRSCMNTMEQALDICDALGGAGENIGLALDVYHIWWDPKLEEQIKRAGDRIFAYHICDWLRTTTDLLLDRGMMYDGVIELAKITSLVYAQGYSGYCEVEIFSDKHWWEEDPDFTLKTCLERYTRLENEIQSRNEVGL